VALALGIALFAVLDVLESGQSGTLARETSL
jgi:hypothetical protein